MITWTRYIKHLNRQNKKPMVDPNEKSCSAQHTTDNLFQKTFNNKSGTRNTHLLHHLQQTLKLPSLNERQAKDSRQVANKCPCHPRAKFIVRSTVLQEEGGARSSQLDPGVRVPPCGRTTMPWHYKMSKMADPPCYYNIVQERTTTTKKRQV